VVDTNRTVTVRLEADISDFVGDIGVKAPAAVKRLERAAEKANVTLKKTTAGASAEVQELGSKADVTSKKVAGIGEGAKAAGSKIDSAMSKSSRATDKLGESIKKTEKAHADYAKTTSKSSSETDKLSESITRTNKAQADTTKTVQVAAKHADAYAGAVGRLRVAQLRLAEAQKAGKTGASLAGAEESFAAAERAVKKFEEAGQKSGKAFGSGLKKWLTGRGGNSATDLGKSGGTIFGSGFLGALKTPVLGPLIVAALTAVVLTALPAVGAVAAGAFVTAFGGGLAGLGLVFAAQNEQVKKTWTDTLAGLGADMKLLSTPFEGTLTNIAGYFKRTVDAFNPALSKAFEDTAQPVDQFVNEFAAGLERLEPAIQPMTRAFNAVLADLGPALSDMLGDLSDGLIEVAESVEANPQALGDMVRGVGDVAKTALELVVVLNDVNTSFEQLTGGTSLVDATLKGVQATLAPLIGLFTGLGAGLDMINALTHSTDASGASMSAAAASTANLANSFDKTTGAAKHADPAVAAAAAAVERAKVRAQEAREQFDRFVSSTFRLQAQFLSLSGAQISFQAAIDAASASVKENGRTLDITTEKGRNNQTALNDVAKAANDQTEQMLRSGKSHLVAAQTAEQSKGAFIRLAIQMGKTKPQAEAMARSMISIPNVTREARLTANKKDLDAKLADARKQLADPKLSATKRAKLEATIRQLLAAKAAAQAAIDSLHGKTVDLTVNTYRNMIETHIDRGLVASGQGRPQADGGYWPQGVPSYADGKLPTQAMVARGKGRGLVQWAEEETGGEAFIPLAPSKRDRSTEILSKVAKSFGLDVVRSFASGGFLPGGRLVDLSYLLRQMNIPFNPLAGINYSGTLAGLNKANAAVAPAKSAAVRADRSETQAKAEVARLQRAITLQQRYVAQLRQQGASEAKIRREQKETIGLQDQLYRAKQKATAATKASSAADALYKKRVDAASAANKAHQESIAALIEQQKAAVELAQQVSDSLLSGANIGDLFGQSLTGSGLLADLQGKGADLKQFGGLIAALRKQGLSETLIQQIVGKGAGPGTDVAQAILDGGLTLIAALNKAQAALEQQADLIGAGSAAARFGTKIAGARASAGPVLPRKSYIVGENGAEILTMGSTGGYVNSNRYLGSITPSSTRVVEVHQHLTFYGVSMAEADLIASRANAKASFAARGK